jgi:hypothetical protein
MPNPVGSIVRAIRPTSSLTAADLDEPVEDIQPLAGIEQVRSALTPVVGLIANATNFTTSNVVQSTAIDTAGSAAARPSDIVVPDVRVGDWLRASCAILVANTTPIAITFGLTTYTAGTRRNTYATTTWAALAGVNSQVSGTHSFQLVESDIETDGSVRLRPTYIAAGAREIQTNFFYPFRFEVTGPFR